MSVRPSVPLRPAVGVLADQLLLLRVDTDHRLAYVDLCTDNLVEIVELAVTIRCPAPSFCFAACNEYPI